LGGDLFEASEGAVELLALQLEIDRMKLNCDQRAKAFDAFIQTAQGFDIMFVASTGECLSALNVQLGPAGGGITNGGRKVARRFERLFEFHQRPGPSDEALDMIRVFEQKAIEAHFG
jgi:hypothetical protein